MNIRISWDGLWMCSVGDSRCASASLSHATYLGLPSRRGGARARRRAGAASAAAAGEVADIDARVRACLRAAAVPAFP